MTPKEIEGLRERLMDGGPSNAQRRSECIALLDEIENLNAKLKRIKAAPVVVPERGKPILAEAFADNGAHSHWYLIDGESGEKIWSEDPEECAARGFPVASRLRTVQPGEVAVNEEELRLLRLLRGAVNGWRYHDRPATVVLNALVDVEFFESRERASPTTNEKETA